MVDTPRNPDQLLDEFEEALDQIESSDPTTATTHDFEAALDAALANFLQLQMVQAQGGELSAPQTKRLQAALGRLTEVRLRHLEAATGTAPPAPPKDESQGRESLKMDLPPDAERLIESTRELLGSVSGESDINFRERDLTVLEAPDDNDSVVAVRTTNKELLDDWLALAPRAAQRGLHAVAVAGWAQGAWEESLHNTGLLGRSSYEHEALGASRSTRIPDVLEAAARVDVKRRLAEYAKRYPPYDLEGEIDHELSRLEERAWDHTR